MLQWNTIIVDYMIQRDGNIGTDKFRCSTLSVSVKYIIGT